MINEKKLAELINEGYVNLSPTEQIEVLDTLSKALAVVRAAKALHPDLQSDPLNWALAGALAPFGEEAGNL